MAQTKKETPALSEDEVKKLVLKHLESGGWTAETAWGKQHGIDIDARRGKERWIIEAKGCGSRAPMRVNYFLSALGELLQRMDDKAAKYSIAVPDMEAYTALWSKLPEPAKKRTGISCLFVNANGTVTEA
jgi:hypothetical protein